MKPILVSALLAASQNGAIPVYLDNGPCALKLIEAQKAGKLDARLKLYDAASFLAEHVAPSLRAAAAEAGRPDGSVRVVAALPVKEPSGPRKATDNGCSSDRQADITSRNSQVTASFDSGPGLSSWMRRSTCASRSGR